MGKRLEDLNLPDEPLQPTPAPREAEDVRATEWYRFCREIDDIIATGNFTWAEDTLSDIAATVEKYQRVTEGQRKAVANIEAARAGRGSRRHEGFYRRWR